MNKSIIFDFNRTLFDPEEQRLIPGAKILLTDALFKGFTLFLVTRAEASGKDTIQKMEIKNVFKKILVSEKRNVYDLRKLTKDFCIDIQNSFVIGDSIKSEIVLGNKLGFTTIWFCNGKFSSVLPSKKIEKPSKIVKNLGDIKKLLK